MILPSNDKSIWTTRSASQITKWHPHPALPN